MTLADTAPADHRPGVAYSDREIPDTDDVMVAFEIASRLQEVAR